MRSSCCHREANSDALPIQQTPESGLGYAQVHPSSPPDADHVLRRFSSSIAAVPMRAAPPTMTQVLHDWPSCDVAVIATGRTNEGARCTKTRPTVCNREVRYSAAPRAAIRTATKSTSRVVMPVSPHSEAAAATAEAITNPPPTIDAAATKTVVRSSVFTIRWGAGGRLEAASTPPGGSDSFGNGRSPQPGHGIGDGSGFGGTFEAIMALSVRIASAHWHGENPSSAARGFPTGLFVQSFSPRLIFYNPCQDASASVDSVLYRIADKVGSTRKLQLAEDVAHMVLGGLRRNEKRACNRAVSMASCHQLEHLTFAR